MYLFFILYYIEYTCYNISVLKSNSGTILAGCCVVENILSNFKLPKFWSAWNASLVLRSRPNLLNTFHNLGICLLLKQPLETEKNVSIDEFQAALIYIAAQKLSSIIGVLWQTNQSSNSALFVFSSKKTSSFIDFLFFHPFMSLVLAIFLNEANWGALFSWDSSGRNCKCSQKSLKPGFYCYPPGFCSYSVSKLLRKKCFFQHSWSPSLCFMNSYFCL